MPPDDKLLPQNPEAERAAVGAMLIDPGAVALVRGIAAEDDFLDPRHRAIVGAIYRIADRGEGVDWLTVQAESRVEPAYLAGLLTEVPTSIHAEHYARLVARAASRRRLAEAAGEIARLAYDDGQDADEACAEATRLVMAAHRPDGRGKPLRAHMGEYYDRLEALSRGEGEGLGLPTGFVDLDRLSPGLLRGYVVLAGRPSMGKSALALDIARFLVRYKGRSVVYFSMEDSWESVVARLVSKETGMAVGDLRDGRVRDWGAFMEAFTLYGEALGDLLWLDDSPGLSVPELRARAMRRDAEVGVDLVVVDYLQLARSGDRRRDANAYDRVSDVSDGLRSLARTMGVPVLAVSQLSRACESRLNKRPLLSDLRESGTIEQDADEVWLLYRDDYYNPETEQPNVAEVHVAKHRNGPTGTVSLWFKRECAQFKDLEVRVTSLDGEVL
jgi:replicative DNA helicase